MKNEILEYLKETKESIIEDFLQDNCQKVAHNESYGDTEVNVGSHWRDGDYNDAEEYAEQIIKEAFEEFFNLKSVDIAGAIEDAKKVFDKI
jgi:hypothetical protein